MQEANIETDNPEGEEEGKKQTRLEVSKQTGKAERNDKTSRRKQNIESKGKKKTQVQHHPHLFTTSHPHTHNLR